MSWCSRRDQEDDIPLELCAPVAFRMTEALGYLEVTDEGRVESEGAVPRVDGLRTHEVRAFDFDRLADQRDRNVAMCRRRRREAQSSTIDFRIGRATRRFLHGKNRRSNGSTAKRRAAAVRKVKPLLSVIRHVQSDFKRSEKKAFHRPHLVGEVANT